MWCRPGHAILLISVIIITCRTIHVRVLSIATLVFHIKLNTLFFTYQIYIYIFTFHSVFLSFHLSIDEGIHSIGKDSAEPATPGKHSAQNPRLLRCQGWDSPCSFTSPGFDVSELSKTWEREDWEPGFPLLRLAENVGETLNKPKQPGLSSDPLKAPNFCLGEMETTTTSKPRWLGRVLAPSL